ncbi:serine/threonine-protein kinase Nek2-like isoform X2 [Littorina saxatilis]|uniref:non-specific serine/threonine protein kinase n=2 Tax=Littorina saxatilis TaxID=31220 RepID=A0AAN9GCL1_9CAEN
MASSLDDFQVVSTIGTGSYGTCKKIRRKKDGKIMVWKEMDYGAMSEAEKQLLVSEVNLLRELKHRHIVRYYDRIIDRSRAVIYILMEYCQGGDLATVIARCRKDGTKVDEDFAWRILIQITLALKECHRRKNGKSILHRDLKPANIFLDRQQNVKLGDFGLARVLHHETSFAQTYVGTPYYMSPELVNNMSYNDKSDVWALGCLLYELCALHPPFIANNQTELNRKIRIGDYPRIPAKYCSELDRIVRRMLKVEVTTRPSINDILRDPIVARRYQQVESSSEQHTHSSDSYDGASGGSAGKANNNNNNKRISAEGGARVGQLEEEYKKKLRQLDLKEKELESRERSVSMREKLADEKLKRAMEMLDHYRRRSESAPGDLRRYSDLVSPRDALPTPDLDLLDSPHSCLSKGPKASESPKKRVSFDFYGKENLRQKTKLSDYRADGLTTKYDIYAQHLTKQPDLKDHLLLAKEKPLDLHRIGLDTKYNARNLLFFR